MKTSRSKRLIWTMLRLTSQMRQYRVMASTWMEMQVSLYGGGTQAGSAISLEVNTAISNAADPARLLAAKAAATNGNGDGSVAEQIPTWMRPSCARLEQTVYQQVNWMVPLYSVVRDSEQRWIGRESPYRTFRLERCGGGRLYRRRNGGTSDLSEVLSGGVAHYQTIDEMMGTLVNM